MQETPKKQFWKQKVYKLISLNFPVFSRNVKD